MSEKRQDETVVDRLRYLIRQSKMSQAEFARRISIDPSNLSKHLSGKLPVNDSLINRIVVDLGVSKQWLRDGTDVPYAKSVHARELEIGQPVHILSPRRNGVPVYDIDVTAGCAELSRMFTEDRIVGVVDLPQLNRSCSIVRVNGDSMTPVIMNGGFIAIRPLTDRRNIFWGQIYVIVMEDYRMVKYLRRHPEKDKVILHSANPTYDDMEVMREDIIDLYLVESIINYDLRC
ncbi:MAG: LexA family transcriptional regulator [Muribaculaceae bacterium]|nr:LexA family transcriptional regulator [Muribaculaceae bacterium]